MKPVTIEAIPQSPGHSRRARDRDTATNYQTDRQDSRSGFKPIVTRIIPEKAAFLQCAVLFLVKARLFETSSEWIKL
ncbi:hypothetical protein SLA2020_380390 [Shorea laevis]